MERDRHERIGRLGTLLLPLEKLKRSSPRGPTFEKEIHDFLVARFTGYTVASGNISGHWKDAAGKDHSGEYREYRVAFPDETNLIALERFAAVLAKDMGEECIYFQIGEEAFLIRPEEK